MYKSDLISKEIINAFFDEFSNLDSSDNWLTEDPSIPPNNSSEHIILWIKNAFTNEKTRETNVTLVKKLDELKPTSPSIDSRTFTRKRKLLECKTISKGGLSLLSSSINEKSSSEDPDNTFEVPTNKKSLNDTFSTDKVDTTFTLSNDIQLNNIDDIHSNTITKSRDHNNYKRFEFELNLNPNNSDHNLYLSPEESFRANMSAYTTSTPLVSNYANLTHEISEQTILNISPEVVTNLKINNSYTRDKGGKNGPNLSKRLQPLVKGMGFNSTRIQTIKRMGNPLTNNTLLGKASSDSCLLEGEINRLGTNGTTILNKTCNNKVNKKVSKIPGPNTIRLGLPSNRRQSNQKKE